MPIIDIFGDNTELYAKHICHAYNDERSIRKYRGFYGKVQRREDEKIRQFLFGRVLDLGAGYGATTAYLLSVGVDVVACDVSKRMQFYAKSAFNVDVVLNNDLDKLPFEDNAFDCVLLRESADHFTMALWKEIERVCEKRIVVFNSTNILICQLARKLIGHLEYAPISIEECSELLGRLGFTYNLQTYYLDVLAFPLSGGLLAQTIFPDFDLNVCHKLAKYLMKVDGWLESQEWVPSGVFWRYLLSLDKMPGLFCPTL